MRGQPGALGQVLAPMPRAAAGWRWGELPHAAGSPGKQLQSCHSIQGGSDGRRLGLEGCEGQGDSGRWGQQCLPMAPLSPLESGTPAFQGEAAAAP